jgi:hypothetical protein
MQSDAEHCIHCVPQHAAQRCRYVLLEHFVGEGIALVHFLEAVHGLVRVVLDEVEDVCPVVHHVVLLDERLDVLVLVERGLQVTREHAQVYQPDKSAGGALRDDAEVSRLPLLDQVLDEDLRMRFVQRLSCRVGLGDLLPVGRIVVGRRGFVGCDLNEVSLCPVLQLGDEGFPDRVT